MKAYLYTAPVGGYADSAAEVHRAFSWALDELKAGRAFGRWSEVTLVTENPLALPHPRKTALALRLMSRGKTEVIDKSRQLRVPVTWRRLAVGAFAHPKGTSPADAFAALQNVMATLRPRPRTYAVCGGLPLYLRTNMWFGASVGGSYSHATGIINAMRDYLGGVEVLTTDGLPGLRSDIPVSRFDLARIEGWQYGEGVHLTANVALFDQALALRRGQIPAFVYQRASLGDLTGLRLARYWQRPYVLEFNGPEVWVADHWGKGIRYAEEFETIETTLLREADLVCVVSEPLRAQALERGVAADRLILVPNAADAQRFYPGVSGKAFRSRLTDSNERLLVLLSSFGPWHGVHEAIHAFAQTVESFPSTRLVLAGDGAEATRARATAHDLGIANRVDFLGPVAHGDAPALLAAGDILLSPQTPNNDGTPFFGSPTKLFEYMAMGKPILASDLEQIGRVLEHGRTAWLTPPGDIEALAAAMRILLSDPSLCAALGREARKTLVGRHTWKHRVAEISDAVAARVAG